MKSGSGTNHLFQKILTHSIGLSAMIVLSVISLFSLSTTYAADPVPWISTASIGCPSQGAYSHMAELNGIIYFHPTTGQTFWQFDTSTETCTQLADMPNSEGERDLVAADSDTILLYQYDAQQPEGYFDMYKISEDRWYAKTEALFDDDTPIAAASNVQGDGAAIIADPSSGFLYVMNGGTTTTFQRFDPGTNAWATLATMPATVDDGGSMAIIGNTIYAFGGNDTTNFWSYDISGNSWNTGLSAAPATVAAGGSLTTDGTDIYAFRGNNVRDFWKYTVGTDTWSNLADAPGYVRAGAALSRIGNNIFAFQGNGTRVFWRYDIVGDTWDETLTQPPSTISSGGSLTTDGTNLYATRGQARPDFWTYNVAGDAWSQLPQLPEIMGASSRVGDKGGIAYVNNTIWAITGNGTGAKNHATIDFIFRYPLTGINANTWPVIERPESFPENGLNGQAVIKPGASALDTAADYIYILGGGNSRWFWRYSIANQAFAPYARALINATDTISYKLAQHFPTVDSGSGNTMTKIGSDFYVAIGDGNDFDGYFFKYTPATNTWIRLADTPGDYWNHACSLEAYNTTTIYAICGIFNGAWKYDIADDYWIGPFPLATYDDGTPFNNFALEGASQGASQSAGSNITAIGSKIYVSRGGQANVSEFDYDTNSWTYTVSAPATLLDGSTLEAIGDDIYALRAGNTGTFYVLDTLTNSWTELANFGENVSHGADLHYPGAGDYIYSFRGDNTTTFKRYCFQSTGSGCTLNTWETLATSPATVQGGGSITSIGTTTLYALRGNLSDDFWTYDIATDQWNTVIADPSDTPETVGSGGDLTTYDNGTPSNSADDIIYAVRGTNDTPFWIYTPNTDTWTYSAYVPVPMSIVNTAISEYGGIVYAPEIGDIFATPGYSSNGIDETETVAYLYRYKLTAGANQYRWPHTKFGTDVSSLPASGNFFYGQTLTYPGAGDKVYATSGNSDNNFIFFDVNLEEWIPFTRALSHIAGDAISQAGPNLTAPAIVRSTNDGYFYVLDQINANLDNFYRYDHTNNDWQRLAPFPLSQSGSPSPAPHMIENPNNSDELWAVYEDKATENFWTYTISTNSWINDHEDAPTRHINMIHYPGDGDWLYAILGQSSSYTYDVARYSMSKDLWISFKWARFDGDVSAGANPAVISQDEDGAYGNGSYHRGIGTSITSANDKLYIQNGSGNQVGKRNYFLEYDPGTNAWTDLAQSPNDYDRGASLVWDGGDYLYGFTGNSTSFYRYCLPDAVGCTPDTWSALTDAPAIVEGGTSLAIPPGSEYIYVLRSNLTQTFWAYCIPGSSGCTGDTWTTLNNTPETIRYGGSLVAVSGTELYALRGNNSPSFYKYTISSAPSGSWSLLPNTPANINSGGRLTWDGGNYLYTMRGEPTAEFYRYDLSGNSWSTMSSSPEPVTCSSGACGGGVTYNPGTGDIWLITASGMSGQIGDQFLSTMVGLLYRYNITNDEWVIYDVPASTGLANNANYRPSAMASFGDDEYIYYVNGHTAPHEFRRYQIQDQAGSPDITELDPGPGSWEVLANTPRPKNGPTLSAVDTGIERLLYTVIGNGTNLFYKYDPAAQHKASLYGGQMELSQVDVSTWTAITDGEFRVTIDGTQYDITGIDYSSATNMQEVADITQAAIRAETSSTEEFLYCEFEYLTVGEAGHFILRSPTAPGGGGTLSYMSNPPTGGTYIGGNNYFEGELVNTALIKAESTSGDWLDCDEAGAPDYLPEPMGSTASGSLAGESFYDPLTDEIWVADAQGDHGNGLFLNPHKGLLWRFIVDTQVWPSIDPPSDFPANAASGAAIAVHDNDTLYLTRGLNTNDIYRYIISTDTWAQLSDLPGLLTDGGSLVSDGINTLFATRGNNSNEFYSYDIGLNSWTDLTGTDPTPENLGSTSTQTQTVRAQLLDDDIWITTGLGDADAGDANGDFFYRFDTAAGDWQFIPGVTQNSDPLLGFTEGSDLASVNGVDLYAVAGTETNTDNFWNYNILTDTWTALTGFADIGSGQQTADDGTSIAAFEDKAIYALRGVNTDQFYRYDILGNIWEQPTTQQFPVNVGSAGSQDLADMIFSVIEDGLFAFPGSGTIIYKIDTTDRVAPNNINGGNSPTQFTAFDVDIQAIDLNSDLVTVPTDRTITLSLETGTGNLGGTLTGTILAGQTTGTISGVTYDTDEAGVQIRATDTSAIPILASAVSDPFTVNPPPPVISTLDITNGSTAGGTAVTITGTFFTDTPNVTFDGYDADQVSYNSSTEIVAVTPAHTAGSVDVQVINPSGQTSNTLTNAFTYGTPTITNITPAAGPTSGGTSVTISGTNFGPGSYRREISLDNTAGGAKTNYEVAIPLDTASLIAAGKMRSDCGDIRVKANNQITNLPYWVEEGSCNTSSTNIWTKVPSIPGSGLISIYMTYGNPNLTTTGVCEDVFIFCDDFNGEGINTNKWGGDTGQFTVGNGVLSTGGTNNDRLSSVDAYTGNYILESKHRTTTLPTGGYTPLGFFESISNGAGYLNQPGSDFYREDGSYINIGSDIIPLDTNLRYSVSMYGTSVDLAIDNYSTGASIHSVTDNDNGAINENIALGERYDNGFYNQSYSAQWDWIYIRTYDANEPTINMFAETGAALEVEFDNVSATNITLINSTTLSGTTPAHALGFVDVDVSNFDGTLGGSSSATATEVNGFEYRTPPTLTSITPNIGFNSQTYNIQFDGSNFTNGITGRLEKDGESDIVCTSVVYIGASQFTCDLDLSSAALGTWDVIIENPDTLTDSLPDEFTINQGPPTITDIDPSNGPIIGGTNVTITGSNFLEGGSKHAITLTNSGSELTNHQVQFQFDTRSAINLAQMNGDCSDIRVLDSNSANLSHWVEGPCNTDHTVIWAVVPTVPNGTKDIFFTYGNPTLTSESELNAVFPALADATNTAWFKGNSITANEPSPVTFDQTMNITTTGNDVEKTAGGNNWNSGFSTNESFTGDGIITWRAERIGTMRSMIGLDVDSAITGVYTVMDFAIYNNNGSISVYENGTLRGNYGSYTVNDVLSVESKDGKVIYRKNGEEFYVSTVTPENTLYGEGAFYDQGTIVYDIELCQGSCSYASVTTFSDQSGNGNNATAIPDNAPAYISNSLNGLPTFFFDGNEDYMALSNLDLVRNVPGVSMFSVAQSDTTGTNEHIFSATTPSSTTQRASLYRNGSTFGAGGRRLDANGFQSVSGGTFSTGTYTFESGILDYANSDAFLYSNGSLINSTTTFQTDGNSSDTASATIWIGDTVSNTNFDGNIAELIIFNDAVSSSDRQEIERYLDAKYAISGNEPTSSVGTETSNTPQITFDGLNCANIAIVNSSTLTCDTPAHAAGPVDVTVTNPDGQNATLNNGFSYVGEIDETTSSFTAATATTIANGATNNILTAIVRDSGNTPIEGEAVTVAQTAGSGTTYIQAVNCAQADVGTVTKGTTNASGQACFIIRSEDITSPGSNTYTATITSIATAITQTADVEFIADYADLENSTFTSSPGTINADGIASSTLTATLIDPLGRFVTGQSVSITDDGSGITYSPISANENTNGSGVADFDVTSTTAQTATFTANLDNTNYYDTSNYTEVASPTFVNDYDGTAATLIPGTQGDDVEATTTLPFDFELFGTNTPAATNIYVCSNGFISLASTGCPTSGALSNAIAGFFRDLDTSSGGIYREVASDNNSVRILWDAVDGSSGNPIFFEIILYQNNAVEFHYFANDGQTARIGLFDGTSSTAPDEASTFDNSVFSSSQATRFYNPIVGPTTPAVVQQPQVTFTAGTVDYGNSTVVANPTSVVADGVEISTITVTMRDSFNNPIAGRTIELSDDQAVTQIEYVGYADPPPYPTDVSDASGEATFQVRSTAVDTATFTANDITGATTLVGTVDVEFTCIVGANQQCVQVQIEPTAGVLTITAPDNFAFPEITSSTSAQSIFSTNSTTPYTVNDNDVVVVTDTQNSGGFTLQLQASAFEDSGTSEQIPLTGLYTVTQASNTGGTAISGVEYDNGYAGVTNITAPQNNATAGALNAAGTFTTNGDNLDTIIDLMLAPVTIGEVGRIGQFKQNVQYYLQIPAFQLAGSYEVTLTFDLTRTAAQ